MTSPPGGGHGLHPRYPPRTGTREKRLTPLPGALRAPVGGVKRARRKYTVRRSPKGHTRKDFRRIPRAKGTRAKRFTVRRPRRAPVQRLRPARQRAPVKRILHDRAPVQRDSGVLAASGTRGKIARSSHGCRVPELLSTGARCVPKRAPVERVLQSPPCKEFQCVATETAKAVSSRSRSRSSFIIGCQARHRTHGRVSC